MISIVGYRESVGHELVSEEAASWLEREWRAEVVSAALGDLDVTKEYDLLRVLLFARREATESEGIVDIADTPEITLGLLKAAHGYVTSQPMGSRAVSRAPRLAWDALIEVFGDEGTLRRRIESLKETRLAGSGELLELADRYLAGWRPNVFGDNEGTSR